jgi:hypothetical protein
MLPVNRPCLRMICFVAATTAFAPERATAEPITFFGEDLNLSGDPNTQIPHPNSQAVEALFLSNLTGVRTETFEGFAPQTESPLAIAFPGAGIATLTGRGDTDFFGFDDMTIRSSEQVTPIPQPASMLLLATGLAGAGARQLRRRRKPAPVKRPSAESGCTMRTGCAMISD